MKTKEIRGEEEEEEKESDKEPELELSSCIRGQPSGWQPWVSERFG